MDGLIPAVITTSLVAIIALVLCFMEAKRADHYREKLEELESKKDE